MIRTKELIKLIKSPMLIFCEPDISKDEQLEYKSEIMARLKELDALKEEIKSGQG